jgi:hypothetical protein
LMPASEFRKLLSFARVANLSTDMTRDWPR